MYQKNEIKARALEEARYVIDNNATVRQTAKFFGISKSTVHKDISKRLWSYSPILATEANLVFRKNKKERAQRGGFATKLKWLHLKDTI